ncbi:MAG: hypothetical protein A2622_04470 [Bdellovibrionales bacterium RIFCSPHIGHO2_01_FULL_40_29]|nr:MAG: hypothetical protein A2622_04470 [Bdellovibrionales bacterium RIFCSPHIGHO2_01_FULL_40_29]OFZ34811.1 MAG: hypothetical protein A3D17_10905 [Bdellovibrionales bacterium RIFCSPHIGHO2_02_FULL_40_15]
MVGLTSQVQFIQQQMNDPEFKLDLSERFSSHQKNYRLHIRNHLIEKYVAHFNPQQLASLTDLNILPLASRGYFSISHSLKLGGFSYSTLAHGFDLEDAERISMPVLERTSTADERTMAPDAKYLWVAKEAAFKSFAGFNNSHTVADFICSEWKSHPETHVQSFRVLSKKTLEQTHNRGFVFSEKDILFGIYFK